MPFAWPPFSPSIGDHVRIVLHPRRGCDDAPHYFGERDLLGRVVATVPESDGLAHRYLVDFGRPIPCALATGRVIVLSCRLYAADELERVA